MAANIPARYRPLRPYLIGGPNEIGEVQMHCPLHPDESRSASLNVKSGVWICFSGCGGGRVKELFDRREEWTPPPAGRSIEEATIPESEERRLDSQLIRKYQKQLAAAEGPRKKLMEKRGLTEETLHKYKIGYDGRSFTIPVFDAKGDPVNIRFYSLNPTLQRNKWNLKGYGSPARLYPFRSLAEASDYIIICEGEWDALISCQAGFPAITRTGSATSWNAGWSRLFAGKIVYICQDRDKPGEIGTLKIGRSVSKYAEEVRVVRLPFPVVEDHGKDISDFWLEHGGTGSASAREKFQTLLNEAQPFDIRTLKPREVDPADAEAIDALNAELFGTPLRLTVTVKGKARGGYTLPHRVEMECTRDAGAMCAHCPMQESGSGSLEIERRNPAILAMLGANNAEVDKAIKELAGIPPRCPKVEFDKTYQSVEILHARPSVEHVNGSRVDFTPLRITSVGRHNTPSNCTVQVVGSLVNNPRNQENEFQAWDVAELRTLDEDFNIDYKMVELLERFRPARNQSVLTKLREIADELAATATKIYGRPHLHAAMDLVWHSVLQFPFRGEVLTRGWLELLVVGDTRTGKSEVATRLINYYQAGEVVNCEAASFAGVVGGTQQIRNEWMLTWGTIPINDRRLVVLDEISGLSVEEIGQMSSLRSSGVAAIEKIVSERTPARTRLIWMGNPRDDVPMGAYPYGVYAIKPLIGRSEDIARFDLALSLSVDDVDVGTAIEEAPAGTDRYTREACSALVRWAWTRTPDDVHWEEGAEDLVVERSLEMGEEYIPDPPLVLKNDLRIKIARVAVALAARLFSSEDGHDLYVKCEHVEAAAEFIDSLYSLPSFGYKSISKIVRSDRKFATEQEGVIREYLGTTPELVRFLSTLPESRFYARDLEEVMNISREQSNGIINKLISARMIQKDRGAVRVLPQLQHLLKEFVE